MFQPERWPESSGSAKNAGRAPAYVIYLFLISIVCTYVTYYVVGTSREYHGF